MPGRRKRDNETYGLHDADALALYTEGKALLTERGQWNIGAAAVLKSAATWRQEASEVARAMDRELRKQGSEDAKSPTRLRAMVKNKALCELEMRKCLDDLLLLPRPPRGRPSKDEADGDGEDEEKSAWEAFDEDDGGGGP